MPLHQFEGRRKTKGCFYIEKCRSPIGNTKLQKICKGKPPLSEKNQQGNRQSWRTKSVYLKFFTESTKVYFSFGNRIPFLEKETKEGDSPVLYAKKSIIRLHEQNNKLNIWFLFTIKINNGGTTLLIQKSCVIDSEIVS